MDPTRLYIGLMFFNSLLFSMIFLVTSLYEVSVAGLSGLQLVLVGTTVEVTILLFEIPTGVVADAYSRRISVIIGYFIMGLGFIVEGSFPVFIPILLAQVLWGVGYTFTSGATQAWLSDEIGEAQANRTFLRANQFELGGALMGMLVAIPLGNLALNLPIVLGGCAIAGLAGVLMLVMPENGFHPVSEEKRNTWQGMAAIFKKGMNTVRARPTLLAILGVGLVFGLYSEGWDRLWTKYLVDNFAIPNIFGMNAAAFFGLLRAGGMILAILVTRWVEKRLDTSNRSAIARAMMGLTALLTVSIIMFAFSPALVVSIGAIWLVSITRNVMAPLYDAWVNQRLDTDTRATVISMSGQVDAIGQIASGPLAGLISLWSIKAAITCAGFLLTPALPLIARVNRLQSEESALNQP